MKRCILEKSDILNFHEVESRSWIAGAGASGGVRESPQPRRRHVPYHAICFMY